MPSKSSSRSSASRSSPAKRTGRAQTTFRLKKDARKKSKYENACSKITTKSRCDRRKTCYSAKELATGAFVGCYGRDKPRFTYRHLKVMTPGYVRLYREGDRLFYIVGEKGNYRRKYLPKNKRGVYKPEGPPSLQYVRR